MKISVSGAKKIDIFGLFGPEEVSVEALAGDFHITEQTFLQSQVYACRTASATITSYTIVGTPTSSNTVLKMLNADADKLRFRERVEIRDSSDVVVGYALVESIVASASPDASTHKNVTFLHSGVEGKYLARAIESGDYLFLPEDTTLFEGEKTIGIDTTKYQAVFVYGTGILQVTSIKKKV